MTSKTSTIIQNIGNKFKQLSNRKSSSWWYTRHMAASSRAIAQRIPLIDFVLEVRDARIPLSSAYEELTNFTTSSRHIIIFNKADLANRSELKGWMRYFHQQNNISVAVNAHSERHIKDLLNFLQARVKELSATDNSREILTFMLVGIPNVGKSFIANSLHQIGRIKALEKGKLKHAKVSKYPGDTKNISGLKIASHPNVYVFDTPGVLTPEILDAETCCKLALTGAIDDIIVEPTELAQYALSIINLGKEYKKWDKFAIKHEIYTSNSLQLQKRTRRQNSSNHTEVYTSNSLQLQKRTRRQISSNHTECTEFKIKGEDLSYSQRYTANYVRKTLYEAITSFDGDLESEDDLAQLIEKELRLLHSAFDIPAYLKKEDHNKYVASELINLYRTGILGHYVLDSVFQRS